MNLRIQLLSTVSIVLTAIITVLLVLVIYWSNYEFEEIQEYSDEYIACANAAQKFEEASVYLTEQVRLYTVTQKGKYMQNYFEEIHVIQRRESAVDSLMPYLGKTEALFYLQQAMERSNRLMKTECHAMRLVAEAIKLPLGQLPAEVQLYILPLEEQMLSKQQQILLAQELVSNISYQECRSQVTQSVDACMSKALIKNQNGQERATRIFRDSFWKLKIGIVLLLILLIGGNICTYYLVVRPLVQYSACIEKGERLPLKGGCELCNLARVYNEVCNQNEETQKLLRHEAKHDALTDLLNKGAFNRLLEIYETGKTHVALILIDVDVFKHFNDTYGHEVGDKVLKKVAESIQHSFRAIDYPCRIGGDEFAVIMVEMTPKLRYAVEAKLQHIQYVLAHPKDGLPPITLSIGIAFSDSETERGDLFRHADAALYHVKEHGRNNYRFYEKGDGKKKEK